MTSLSSNTINCQVEELFHCSVNSACGRIKLLLQSVQGLISHTDSWQILTRDSSPSKPFYIRRTWNAPLETISSLRNDVFASLLSETLDDFIQQVTNLRLLFEYGVAKSHGKIVFFKRMCSGVRDLVSVVISEMKDYVTEINQCYAENVLIILGDSLSFLDQVALFIPDSFLNQHQLLDALKVIVPPRLVIDIDLSITNLYYHQDLHGGSDIYFDCLEKMKEVVDMLCPREIILSFSGYLDEFENPMEHHLERYDVETVTEIYLSAVNDKKPSHPLNHSPTLQKVSASTIKVFE
eukprot:TRINITY_DN1257_c0_g1_i3.p1 TRINITY_DN1257_c0_g1~~TRINITY_DN1257_c0_g1_i3.p1  ORF type:complete len:294 (+),score=34.86 TRINITY_DN1257_c0_g1_i3:262-1143(+)